MRKKLLHNWGLKLASLVLAFVLWFLVVQINDPTDTGTFSNIQVKLTNTDLLEKENKVYEILDNSDVVRVTVRAPGSIIDKLRSTDIVAEADVSRLTDINTVPITYYVMNADVDYTIEGNHDFVKLNVEEKASKYVSLVSNPVGEVADGFIVGNVTLDQNMIEVSGPESAVEQVAYARADINVSGASNSLSANVDIRLYDKEGEEVTYDTIKKQADYAHISVEVLAVKEVPIELAYTGTPEEGYMTTGVVECNPATIRIAGTLSTISNVSKISIPEERLSIEGAQDTVSEIVNIREYLPDNVKVADSSVGINVKVSIYIEPIVEKTLQIPAHNLNVINLPTGLNASLPQNVATYTLQVEGLGSTITPLRADTVTGTLDMKAWMEEQGVAHIVPGTYQVPVAFNLAEDVTVANEVTAQVIVKEEDES